MSNEFILSTQLYVLSRGLRVIKIGVSKKDSTGYLYLGPLDQMPNKFKCPHTLIEGYMLFNDGSWASSAYCSESQQHVWETHSWESVPT